MGTEKTKFAVERELFVNASNRLDQRAVLVAAEAVRAGVLKTLNCANRKIRGAPSAGVGTTRGRCERASGAKSARGGILPNFANVNRLRLYLIFLLVVRSLFKKGRGFLLIKIKRKESRIRTHAYDFEDHCSAIKLYPFSSAKLPDFNRYGYLFKNII